MVFYRVLELAVGHEVHLNGYPQIPLYEDFRSKIE
jgi:hypothetical protein